MTTKELREKTSAELEIQVRELKEELFNLRFKLAVNQLENPMRIPAVKKDIARIKSIIREREIASGNGADL